MSSTAVPETFKAYTYESYGKVADVLKISEVANAPLAAQQVRIKVHSAAINPVDYMVAEMAGAFFTGSSPTKDKPYRIGFDVAGTVVQFGAGVHASRLQIGDQVYAMASFTECGTVAEYIDIDQQYVARKPSSLDFDQAASVPLVALTSYQALYEYTQLKNGKDKRVLILGGSSATGMYAVQFAKLTGAFVAVTASADKTELLTSLGADQVIDYKSQKWVDALAPHSIDIVYDCGFEPNSWNGDAQTVLKQNTGQFVTLLGVRDAIPATFGATNHGGILVYPTATDLNVIAKLFDEGKLKTVVDSVVPFEKLVDGLARVASRRAVGKVVVKVL